MGSILAVPSLFLTVQAAPPSLAPVQVETALTPAGLAIHQALSRYAEYGLSGIVLMEQGGQRIPHAAYGWADAARQIPMRVTTPLNIQSMTKPIVASLALKLVGWPPA